MSDPSAIYPLPEAISQENARRRIDSFTKRFSPEHLYLAYHAAFPLALTPDLLYALWAYFSKDSQDNYLKIPWIAVADVLLSHLCQEAGRDLYVMNITIRNTLLKRMQADPHFGQARIMELSRFMLWYVDKQRPNEYHGGDDWNRAQRWMALAYTEPSKAVEELSSALSLSWHKNDVSQQLRIATLIQTLAEPLASFVPLLTFASSTLHLIYETAEDQVKTKTQIEHVLVQDSAHLRAEASTPTPLEVEVPTTQSPISPIHRRDTPVPPSELSFHPNPIFKSPPSKNSFTCPSCFVQSDLLDCRIFSGTEPNVVLKEVPQGRWERLQARNERLDMPPYVEELARRECPKCGYLLPHGYEYRHSLALAVIGDLFTGKSHYITILMHQMRQLWGSEAGIMHCLTPEVENYYVENYLQPLLERKERLSATTRPVKPVENEEQNMQPLIYQLTFPDAAAVNLLIYDVSGEAFASEKNLANFAPFIFYQGACIFVIDPITIHPILQQFPVYLQSRLRQELRDAARLHISNERRAAERINATITLLERYHDTIEGAPLNKTPVAMMVSKSDLLQYLSPAKDYTFMRQVAYGNYCDLQDNAIVDKEVQSLLREYKQGDLMNVTAALQRRRFLATSATGGSPNEQGVYDRLEPRRCLDPLLWILYEFGVLKGTRAK